MAPQNSTPDDTQTLYIFLTPAEVSALAVSCLLHGPCPPAGISFKEWAAYRLGRESAIPWPTFGYLCDAVPTLLEDLQAIRQARQMEAGRADALAAR
jgi:hypothetical protein